LQINKNQAWQVAKDQTVFKFKDLELEVYFLHMDCNLAQYKESWRGGQRKWHQMTGGYHDSSIGYITMELLKKSKITGFCQTPHGH